MNDLLGGHVPVAFGVLPPALGALAGGMLRAIAVSGSRRFSLYPGRADLAESGLPGFESVLHYGVLAPAGTPARHHRTAEQRNRRAGRDRGEWKKRIQLEGGDPLSSTPDEYAADIDREETKWAALIRKLNLRVE